MIAIRTWELSDPFYIGKDDPGGISCSTTASTIDNDLDPNYFTLIIGGTSSSSLFFPACVPVAVPFLLFVTPSDGLATSKSLVFNDQTYIPAGVTATFVNVTAIQYA